MADLFGGGCDPTNEEILVTTVLVVNAPDQDSAESILMCG